MRNPKSFKLGTIIIGLMALAVLAVGLNLTPVAWIKTTLLQSLSSTSSVAQAASFDHDTQGKASFQLAKQVRPVAALDSSEVLDMKMLPTADQPDMIHHSSTAALLNQCQKRAACRAKLEAISSGKRQPLQALKGETPEEQEIRRGILLPEESSSLLSWLNPFQINTAYAQTIVGAKVVPGNHNSNQGGAWVDMRLYGAQRYPGNLIINLSGLDYLTSPQTENNPNADIYMWIPSTGTYLINVVGSEGKAKMRHQTSGPIIDTWDFTSQKSPDGWFDYLTAEYLQAGGHTFYFWPLEGVQLRLISASLQSYQRL